MKAVIMAGGEGTRLRPLTCNRPKPMVPIINKPVMEHIINLLKKHNIFDIAVTLQYMPEQIRDYFGNGEDFGVNIKYYVENEPLGTAGSVKNAEEFLDDTFLVISGDALTDINLSKAIEFHIQKKSFATIILKTVEVPLEYGVVVTDNLGKINRFLEKPNWSEVFSDNANTGIYILSPEILKLFAKGEKVDFSQNVFPRLLEERKPMYGFITEDYWCDIGDLKAYAQAHADILEGKVKIDIPEKQIENGVWVGEEVSIGKDVKIYPPCIIGNNTNIGDGSTIEAYSVIGGNNIIGKRASIKRSITWKNCILDNNVHLRGSIACNKVNIKEKASAFESSVIGDHSVIGENAIVKPEVKIWPNKVVENGAEVDSNLVWSSKYKKVMFSNRGISGKVNIDITPEYASKLATAYGTLIKGRRIVGISCDEANSSHMFKISLISGLLSAGVEVYDFGKMLLPITRSAIRFYKLEGGLHVTTSSYDQNKTYIDILDQKGCNIDRGMERKIENVFARGDFTRVLSDSIKGLQPVNEYMSVYLMTLINSINMSKAYYKIGINSRTELISTTIKSLLEEFGCHVDIIKVGINNYDNVNIDNGVKEFSNIIKTGKYNLGVSIEETAEKMVLIDDNGRVITDDMFMGLISTILFKSMKNSTVYVPVSASSVLEQIAAQNKGKIVRTKDCLSDRMGSILNGDNKDEFLEQFTMNYDAIAGLIKIIDFMHTNNYKLSELVDMIPKFHMKKTEVDCAWNLKGKVIKEILEENSGKNIETLEGVKIYSDKGWVLVVPDGERPVCRVVGEGFTEEFAQELTDIYVNKVKEINNR